MPARTPASRDFGARVCREIEAVLECGKETPTIASVAARLSLQVRTLQRRLEEEGLSYRNLLSESRRRYATRALRAGGLSIAEIAARLGYSDPAHFARAFRAWTGRTPSGYQRRKGSKPGA